MKHCPNPECIHLKETGRAGEFRDDIVDCSDCGTPLAPGEPPEMDRPGHIRWTAVAQVPDQHAAHLVKTALAMEGIPCELRRSSQGDEGIVAGQPAIAEVIVPEDLVDAARQVLDQRPDAPVALPDDDDLEFLDEDGKRIDLHAEDRPLPEEEIGTGDADWPTCGHCGSSSVTHHVPDPSLPARGLFKRLFSRRPRWTCLACRHQW